MTLLFNVRSIVTGMLVGALALTLVSAADARPKKPSKSVVKRVMTEAWDNDGTGPNYTELEFKKIKIAKMRRRHVNERAPSDWVSPVKVVLIQTITYGPDARDVSRITQKALFYKEMSWYYHSKGADIKRIERY